MAVKLILFDLDGTLVDTSLDITNAINYAIKPCNITPISPQKTISLVGEGITRLMEKIIENNMQQQTIDRDKLVKSFLDYYSEHLLDNTTIYPKVRESLAELRGYKKAVISNKRENLSIKLLEGLDLLKYFDLVIGSDTTAERKPSPIPIFYALSKLNISNKESVIVGDSVFDIEAGKSAGIRTIGVTYGYRPAESLRDADFLIASIDELKDVLLLL